MLQELAHDPKFWVSLAFVVFVGLMVWKASKPILAGIDARGERIKAELDEAQRLREEAQKALAEYKRKQRDAALQQHMGAYAQRLEHYCGQAPLQWFNFFDFWEEGAAPQPSKS